VEELFPPNPTVRQNPFSRGSYLRPVTRESRTVIKMSLSHFDYAD
jgi:hypothetical protein